MSTLPFKSSITCSTLVGDGLPDKFAEGAATGKSTAFKIAWAISLLGSLIATVSSPPVASSGIRSDLLKIIVRGPGQNFSIHFFATSGISATKGSSCEFSAM